MRELVHPEAPARQDRRSAGLPSQVLFQELWARVRDTFGIELPPPDPGDPRRWTGQHCSVALVRSQAALRRLDLGHVRKLLLECRGRRGLPKSASDDDSSPPDSSFWMRRCRSPISMRAVEAARRQRLFNPATPAPATEAIDLLSVTTTMEMASTLGS